MPLYTCGNVPRGPRNFSGAVSIMYTGAQEVETPMAIPPEVLWMVYVKSVEECDEFITHPRNEQCKLHKLVVPKLSWSMPRKTVDHWDSVLLLLDRKAWLGLEQVHFLRMLPKEKARLFNKRFLVCLVKAMHYVESVSFHCFFTHLSMTLDGLPAFQIHWTRLQRHSAMCFCLCP